MLASEGISDSPFFQLNRLTLEIPTLLVDTCPNGCVDSAYIPRLEVGVFITTLSVYAFDIRPALFPSNV
jgi:hypothetical protein